MNETITKPKRKALAGEFFSAKYFLVRAFVIAALFLMAHLAGLREYTTFLSGTAANPNVSFQVSTFYGTAYIVLYLGCVVLAPILVLAAALLAWWERRSSKTSDRSP